MKNGAIEALTEILVEPDAVRFGIALWAFAHTIDDLVDRDKQVTPAMVGTNVLNFVENVAENPFFQANRLPLMGALRSAVFSWVASEEWRLREPIRDKIVAEVLKSGYQEVVFLAASLVKGVPHALEMQRKYRDYEFG